MLFGSYARGTAGPLSDLDIAVLFKPDLSKTERFLLRGEIAEDVRRIVAQTSVDAIRKYLDTKPLRRVQTEYLMERLSQPSRESDTPIKGW
ncbi:MAG: nucleotidyltransferase domain-containing protein [Firmicutes bacterium]|nr:nucleotidyltransferase domain-containing protein [Bacillota bacterium]